LFPALGYSINSFCKILQLHSIKHHLKPTWITVWLPEDKSCQKYPPFTSLTANCSNLAPLYFICSCTLLQELLLRLQVGGLQNPPPPLSNTNTLTHSIASQG
jgi:hypothetical protein